MEKLKVLDLFSGIGGFSLGLERTGGFDTVAFCEIEKYPIQVLNKNWPSVPVYQDVKKISGKQLETDGIISDVICGGFPCQDISLAGKGAGLAGERSGLWFEFHRLIKEIRPSWVIAENVSALRSRGLDQVLRLLAEIGYDAEWHCIPAAAVGAPHRRDRIWIIAYPNANSVHGRSESQLSNDQIGKTICDEFSGLRSNVADPKSNRRPFSGAGDNGQSLVEQVKQRSSKFTGNGASNKQEFMADADSTGLQRRSEAGNFGCLWPRLQQLLERRSDSIGAAWAVEPDVGRVANGVPKRVDRLKALGNAVVPQIPELIGYAILDVMKNGTA